MEIKDGKIAKATDLELYKFWVESGWCDFYPYPEYKDRVKALGTEVIEDESE